MPEFNFLEEILTNFRTESDRNAFYIREKFYSYRELSIKVAAIRNEILKSAFLNKSVGVVLNDDLETYASILALWFSGNVFVPINPLFPVSRNQNIIEQSEINLILNSSKGRVSEKDFYSIQSLDTSVLGDADNGLAEWKYPDLLNDFYVLYTSGSTGVPKGVRISGLNLNNYLRDFISYPSYSFSPEDRFLQIYDLSFDVSIRCFMVPLVMGACVYTVPQEAIKYLAAYKIMLEQKITFAAMPPSTLTYLKPYFSSAYLPDLRYSLLGGESFSSGLAEDWEKCVPNAIIQNIYGPTEVTINCLIYDWNGNIGTRKTHKGIVSIGRPFGSNRTLVVNDRMNPVKSWEEGELLMAGGQVSPGYLKNDILNGSAFIDIEESGEKIRYYKTGDRVAVDNDGDIMFLGRLDEQVQVQGYRVEMGEIEQLARQYLGGINVVAMGKADLSGQMRIYLLVESADLDTSALIQYLTVNLPHYMIPTESMLIDEFPKLVSGKLDRKALFEILPNE